MCCNRDGLAENFPPISVRSSWNPDDIIDNVERIKEARKSGLTLRQIAENRKVERAMDAFVELASMYPGYAIVRGSVKEIKSESGDTIVVEVKLKKVEWR